MVKSELEVLTTPIADPLPAVPKPDGAAVPHRTGRLGAGLGGGDRAGSGSPDAFCLELRAAPRPQDGGPGHDHHRAFPRQGGTCRGRADLIWDTLARYQHLREALWSDLPAYVDTFVQRVREVADVPTVDNGRRGPAFGAVCLHAGAGQGVYRRGGKHIALWYQ